MQVGWNVFEMSVFVGVEHLVHEVHVAEVVAGSGVVLHLERHRRDLLHQVGPIVVADGHDDFVNV